MQAKRRLLVAAIAALPFASAFAAVPAGYPAGYQAVIDAATKEGKVVVYSATDASVVQPLIQNFQQLYPGVKVEYNDLNSTELYNRFISETAAGSTSADVLWSSAMDLQVKLANDGYAQAYKSPEIPNLPDWAHWRDEVFGTTYEPVAFVYNKKLVSAGEVPKTHADFAALVAKEKFKGKVTSYDPEKSGVGFLLVTQDLRNNPSFWNLAKALGASEPKLQTSTGAMMERISSGENLIGYNMLGSYALTRMKKDNNIAYVLPTDYTPVISRLTFIAKAAKNPNAAKLWTDFVLSKRGQSMLAAVDLFSIRRDIEGQGTAEYLSRILGGSLKPVTVGPGLLTYLDQTKRLQFLKQWKDSQARK